MEHTLEEQEIRGVEWNTFKTLFLSTRISAFTYYSLKLKDFCIIFQNLVWVLIVSSYVDDIEFLKKFEFK